jgi:hypothetical protein
VSLRRRGGGDAATAAFAAVSDGVAPVGPEAFAGVPGRRDAGRDFGGAPPGVGGSTARLGAGLSDVEPSTEEEGALVGGALEVVDVEVVVDAEVDGPEGVDLEVATEDALPEAEPAAARCEELEAVEEVVPGSAMRARCPRASFCS